MVGPAQDVQGGISSWIRLITKHPPEGVEYRLISTITPKTAVAEYRGFNTRYLRGGIKNIYHFLTVLASLKRILKKEHYELAHVHFSSRGSTLRKALVARILTQNGVPYLLHAHGGAFESFYRSLSTPLKRRVVLFLEDSKGLIVLSTAMQAFYSSLVSSQKPVFTMPNPVILPKQLPPHRACACVRLVFLGRLGSQKGSDRVLHAIAYLPEEIRVRVEVWLAGDGELEATRQLAESLGLNQQVLVSGWIDVETREQWLREAHAMILPSRAEGVPMALLEGMAWGLPVISSPVGGIPDIITDGQEGFLVPPDDIPAISQAIRRFVEDRDLLQKMGAQARRRAEFHSLEGYREKLKAVYEAVLARVSQAPQR